MQKQSNLSRLMGYAGGYRILTYLSWVLSVMSALLALVPFWYIWRIIHDILEVSPDFSKARNITSYGWSAVLFAVISIVVFAHECIPSCRKYPKRAYALYYSLATWSNGKVWKRKAEENSKQFQCRYGNVSCTQASRQSRGDCHSHRSAFSVACL